MRQENIEDIYPLSPLQQGLLFHTLEAPGSGVYVVQLSCLLEGPLDEATFERACRAVVERHAVLRTAFVWEGLDEPVQVVCRQVELPLVRQDWRGLSPGRQEEQTAFYLRADQARGFVVTEAPLVRLTLCRLAEDRYRLVWTHHHLLLDGWSLHRLIREVLASYEAFRQGRDLHRLRPRRFRDYIAWLGQQSLPAAEAFWRIRLAGFSASTLLRLPAPAQTGPAADIAGGMRQSDLSAAATSALRALVRQQQSTLNTLVQAAWAVALSRYSGEEDVVFGIVSSGRPPALAGAESMVGVFVNTLPLRTRASRDNRLLPWLRELQAGQVEILAFEYSPLRQVQAWSEVPRGEPLFETLLDFTNYPLEIDSSGPGTSLRASEARFTERPSYPLAIIAAPGEVLSLKLLYDPRRLDGPAVGRMLDHLLGLLEEMASRPEARIGELVWLREEERFQLLREWNDTAGALPSGAIQELFEAQARRRPEALAVVSGPVRLSYGELAAWAHRLGRHLRSLGVGPGSLVGVYLQRGWAMIPAVLGILEAGGAYVPLDAGYPPARVRFILSSLGIRWLVTQESLLERDEELWAELPELEHLLTLEPGEGGERRGRRLWTGSDLAVVPAEPMAVWSGGEDLAYIIFTSGSTGTPKGVMVRHAPVVNLIGWVNETFGVGAEDRVLFVTSLCFDLSVYDVFGLLAAGGSIRVATEEEVRDPERLVWVLSEEPITYWDSAPAALQQLVPFLPGEAVESRLRLVFLSGDWVPLRLPEQVRQAFPSAQVVALGGATEATVWSNVYPVCRVEPGWASIPYGRPIRNARYHVLDGELEPCPVGVAGDLYIAGGCLASGYAGEPELTAWKFLPDRFGEDGGGRMYRTGDRARTWGNGLLEFLGRVDHQVKIRGYRIELGEIESVLVEQEGVHEAVVLAREDEPGHRRLVAYVVGAGGEEVRPEELRRSLAARLPEYMVPSAFVVLVSLPVTPNGKLDRRALPPPEDVSRPREGSAAPVSPAERRLAAIWEEVLRVEGVGVHDNFFELGGDSILCIQIVSRSRPAGLHFTTAQLFENPTIAELAAVAGTVGRAAVEEGSVVGPVPLAPIQLWLFEQELPDLHQFNQSILLEVLTNLDPARLARAIDHLLLHHDALRLRFEKTAAGWQQASAAPGGPAPFSLIDLGALPSPIREFSITRSAAELQAGAFELAQGPLLRAVLLRLGPGRSDRLLLVAHHLVVDGVSWRILLEDLQGAYEQLERAEEVRLSAKTTSYREWAGGLRDHARSQALQQELEIWLSVPPGAGAALPVDFPGGSNRNGAAATVSVSLETEETRALLQEVSEAYLTQINDVLLAALCEALSGWVLSPGLLVDLEGHGREEIFEGLDLSRTVGWFTAIFPVWLEPGESRELGSRLKAVKECLRGIPSRGIGYGLLRYLGHEAGAARLRASVQAEVSFNYLGQLDQALPPSSPFRPATESSGVGRSLRQPRRYLLEVSCGVLQGRLGITWSYSERLHRRSTVEALAQRFLAALRDLIACCRSERAGGRTPSDFPLAALDQETLDRLVGNGREVEDLYPLSPLQQGMLFHALQDPGAGLYCQQLVCHVEGEVDADALEKAWQQALGRHTILRTGFAWDDLAEPLQVVHRRAEISLQRIDWSGLPEAQREERLSSWLQRDRAEGFDPSRAPLMRLCLIRLGERDYRFIWTHHHLLLDGWSLPLLYREVFTAYEALRQGRGVDVGRPRPYRDYVAWLIRQDLGRAESFWREYLQGFSTPTVLAGPPRARQAPWEFGRATTLLSSEATAALQSLTRQGQLTLNTLAQGAWGLLLGRYLGRDDVAFGSVVAGRPPDLPGAESILGPFINTLPVRVRLPWREALLPWLGRLQSEQVALRQYEFSPLRRVQEWSRAPREQPLFDTLLVFENYPVDQSLRQDAETLQIRKVVFEERTSYPLALAAVPGRELSLEIVYDRASFDSPFAARALAHLAHLLEEMAAGGDRSLAELSLMSAAEHHQVLSEWNDRPADYDGEVCLHGLFERQVERTPDEVALVFEGEDLTYGQLDARADRLARHLHSLGIGTGARVALCVERSPEMVVAILGILKAGAAYVPLDPGYPQERLAFMLADSGAPVLLAQERCLARLPDSPGTRVVLLDRPWEDPPGEPGQRLDGGAGPDDLAYVIYTSGSTGRPKGVMIPHRAIANRLLWMQSAFPLTPADRLLQKTPVSFDASVWEIFLPLFTGARLVLARPDGHKDSAYLVRAMAEHGITVLQLVPSMLQVLVEEAGLESCASLRRVFAGGEALPGPLQQRLAERLGIELHNLYGPTEASIDVSCRPCRADDVRPVTPIGRPLARLRIFLLDGDLQPLPIGVPGELHIGGVNLAWGYLNRPGLTAERFVPDPFQEGGERLYRTGDLARFLPDGEIEYLGRTDHQVKVRGFRIELGEIEAALLSHPRVRQAVVIVREDHPGDRRLVGYVVPLAVPGAEPDALGRELREHLAGRLPDYMVPTAFVALDELPFTPNGKLDHVALPAPERPRPPGGLVPPRTPTEEAVARIWCEVLGLVEVGAEESFFELGGNSLVAMRLVSRLRRNFGVEVPLRNLFELPTVAGLAEFIDREQLGRATDADEDTLARLLAEVEGLAENDVSLLLSIEDRPVERTHADD